ncbi:SCO family protein [Tranquillimonas alkanivorans]|nr:SCO family protein [Tranquillimonas alkanivorans]
MKPTRSLLLLPGLAVVAFAGGLLWQRGTSASVVAEAEPAIVADFELTGHDGMLRTEEDFRGQWTLVFFRFTHCPDVCPTTLADMAQVMDDLGPQADAVQPLFVSVDSERDDVEALAEYVPQFHPEIIGLAGTSEQIEKTAETFKIYHEKVEAEQAPDGYTMGHSSQIFLFNPEGELVELFSYGTPAAEITAGLRSRIAADG